MAVLHLVSFKICCFLVSCPGDLTIMLFSIRSFTVPTHSLSVHRSTCLEQSILLKLIISMPLLWNFTFKNAYGCFLWYAVPEAEAERYLRSQNLIKDQKEMSRKGIEMVLLFN